MSIRRRFYSLLLSCLLVPVILSSCSDSEPSVLSVEHFVVFDYADNDTVPLVYLAVFAETGSDARRANVIRAYSEETGLEWETGDLIRYPGDEKRFWSGCPKFAVPAGKNLPTGRYVLYYEDMASRVSEFMFTVDYPSDKPGSPLNEVKETSFGGKRQTAVYDGDRVLLYFGDHKKSWKKDSDIADEYATARTARTCYINGGVMYLLPERNIFEEQNADD